MKFMPIDKMVERIDVSRQDSDAACFLSLLYFGEMLTKIVASGLVSAIADDRDRHRYRQIHRLVRADSLGDWGQVLGDILTGPASQHLLSEAKEEQRELTQRCGPEAWQYKSVMLINNCVQIIDPKSEELSTKTDLRRWFIAFSKLRNLTRGHGALPNNIYKKICPQLEESLKLITENFILFKRQWAYLHRNLSGKYRVTALTDKVDSFDSLKSSRTINLSEGVYVYLGSPVRVELIESNVDAMDFFFPNGGFDGKKFELLSYISGDKLDGNAASYLAPATELPSSETQGVGILDVQGKCFGNLPPTPHDYINRTTLEKQLYDKLFDDRHAVVTLVGRGGIGKTSLALCVLHRISNSERFGAIVWFSARDIDLLPAGPKLVKPHVLTEKDIAKEFVRLFEPRGFGDKAFDAVAYLRDTLGKSSLQAPILFVFDNFETVRSPVELFAWIDTYVRPPNKVLILLPFGSGRFGKTRLA